MKLDENELEELLTVAVQCNTLIPKLSYNDELAKNIFFAQKETKELSKEDIKRSYNNYLALALIGLDYSDSNVFKKIDNYMEYEY